MTSVHKTGRRAEMSRVETTGAGRADLQSQSAAPHFPSQSCAFSVGLATLLRLTIFLTVFLSSSGLAQAPIKVEWKGGRLSVSAEKAPLSQILRQVARQTGMEAVGLDKLQQQVSVHLSDVSLSQGLQNLLAHVEYAITEDGSRPEGPRRVRLVVFGERTTSHLDVAAIEGGTKLKNAPAANKAVIQASLMTAKELAAKGDDQEKRLTALHAAAARGDLEALRQAILDPDQTVQATGFEILAEKDLQGAVEALVSATKSDQPASRLQALQLLDQTDEADEETILTTLRDALGDKDGAVKEYAVTALAGRGGPEVMGYLRKALQDPDPSVRIAVLENVAQKDEGLPLLQEALSDPDESVRTSAALWLKQANSAAK